MTEVTGAAGFVFPERSHRSTDKAFTWDEVKAIMDKEIKRRAEYVTQIILAMRERFGDEAYDVAAKAIYQIGYRKGQARQELVKAQGQPNNLESLAELVAHPMAQLYLGTSAEVQPGEMRVCETYCPLPVYWKSMGLPDTENLRFCRIFDQVDKGMVEGYNGSFEAELGGAEQLATKGFCHMTVRQRQPEG
ncbi:MAG: L-2-amino-thiazoline-4-carboxylic acid hydrolase [Anaerolineales bacterium]|nr:L-2-amino-thiazoline-4-carboxylic acid hydrolase [Anaerolineales bacterium]